MRQACGADANGRYERTSSIECSACHGSPPAATLTVTDHAKKERPKTAWTALYRQVLLECYLSSGETGFSLAASPRVEGNVLRALATISVVTAGALLPQLVRTKVNTSATS